MFDSQRSFAFSGDSYSDGKAAARCATCELIAESFMGLVAEGNGLRRVTVVDIARETGISRKTFYNYFETVESLIAWIYRTNVSALLVRGGFAPSSLLVPDKGLHDPFPQMPFYVQVDDGGTFESQKLFFKALGDSLHSRREYYRHLFASSDHFRLFDYLLALYRPAIAQDIRIMLHGRNMSEEMVACLSEYHTLGIFGRILLHYTRTHRYMMQGELDSFFCYGHEMIRSTLDWCCGEEVR